MSTRMVAVSTITAVVAAASASSPYFVEASASVVDSAPWFTPTLVEQECPAGYPPNAVCWTFTVAADRLDPDSGTIVLPVVVLRATGPAAAPDALVIPAGGPGYPGDLSWADSPFIERRDIVVYDQRGTGDAVPSLECPAVDEAFVAAFQDDRSYTAERDAMAAARDECVAALEADGVDLTDYHSEASAADLDELRQALGYEQWNLLGASYGGRLTLATMRSYPEGIRAVILESVYDVTYGGLALRLEGVESAFRRLAGGCSADPSCVAAHGDLNVKYAELRQRYNDEPIAVDVDLGDGNGPQQFVITGDDLMAALFNALYDAALIPLLPSIIDALLAGDTAIIPAIIQRGVPFATGAADAMTLAVDCADNSALDTAAADASAFNDPGRLGVLAALFGACPLDWPATPGEFNAPVVSEIPALVLAGSYDPITPPAGTEQVAEALTDSTFILVDAAGHWVTGYYPCIDLIEVAFLDHPTAELDTACVDEIGSPDFQ